MASGATAPLIVGSALLNGPSVSAQGNADFVSGTYTGRACAVLLQGVKLLGTTLIPDTCLGDSGQLPAAGGTANGPTGPISVGGLLTANVLVSSATGVAQAGVGPISSAASKVAGVTILPGTQLPNPLNPSVPLAGTPDLADVTLLAANTSVNCTTLATPISTTVAAISVGGSPINVTGGANQTISIPLVGSITLNHQAYDSTNNTALGEAVALDLNVLGITGQGLLSGHIALGHAESDLTGCVTGGVVTTPKLPSTGSGPLQLTGASSGGGAFDARGMVLPVGVAAMIASAIATLAWRRRQHLDVDRGQSR